MNWTVFQRSLKTRITLFTLGIFLLSIWSLAFYGSRTLHDDMKRVLGEAQLSTVSYIAAAINADLENRLQALELIAERIDPAMIGKPAALQAALEGRPVFQALFNGGTFIAGSDGRAIASTLKSEQRLGIDYSDRDYMRTVLRDGKAAIGRPVIGKDLPTPLFVMAVPVRGARGEIIGALAGVTNLGEPSFIDEFTSNRYGKTGDYLLVAPQQRLIVTATDKSRVMTTLPPPDKEASQRFTANDEGTDIVVDQPGVEVLTSAKRIPVAGWFVVAAQPTAEAFAPIRDMQRRMLLTTILLTLLAGGLTWRMLKRQLSPLLAAAGALAEASDKGQLPGRLPIDGSDEVGQLVGGVNQLLAVVRQREIALSETERRFHIMADSAPALIWCAGEDAQCQFFNQVWLDFTGRDIEQEIGNGWAEGVHPEDARRCMETYSTAFAARQKFAMEYRLRRFDGEYRWVLDHGVPRHDEQGRFLGYIGSCIDITERKEAEARLEQALLAAEAATRAKSEFLAHMSHEIRTPMNAIVGAARLIGHEGLTTRQRGYSDIMRHSCQSLLALIDDILDLSKIEAGQIEIREEPFNLARLLDSLLDGAGITALGKDIRISLDVAPDLPRQLIGDRQRLEQVLNNLLSNAIKFTRWGKIVLRVQPLAVDADDAKDIRIRFVLSDSGIGIPPEQIDAIFEPFVQAESTTTRTHGGTGLGLSICQRLVEKMGGAIAVESVPGQGSDFTFSAVFKLPSALDETSARPADQEIEHGELPSSAAPLAGRRILMIEDNQFNRVVLNGMLQHLGIEVDVAIDGNDGVECFQVGNPYDAILVDLHMPGLDGFACTRAIRALPEGGRVPIIAVTANVLSTTASACSAAGMNGHLLKPVEPEMLQRTLMRWILGRPPSAPSQAAPVAKDPADGLPDALPGLDPSKAAGWSNGSARALAKLLDRALSHAGDDPARLARHIAGGELDAAARITHDLMAVAATVGASMLAGAARQLNREIRTGNPDSRPAQEALQRIADEFTQLRAAREILRRDAP